MSDPPMPRDFQTDFCLPAIAGLTPEQSQRVAIALDCAIAFGALEHADDNPSLQDLRQVTLRYWANVRRLKTLPGDHNEPT